MKKIIINILLSTILAVSLQGFVLAANNDPCQDIASGEACFNVRDQLNPRFLDTEKDNADHWEDNGNSPIINFFLSIIDFALRIMGPIAVLMIIIAGVFMITSLGKTQKIDEAKDQIFYVFLGLLFAFLSYIIVIFFQGIFSINS